ncbi:outer membrane protein assembly factor BamE [Aestuariibius sp. HNIBRBA575]|uniref:outer membrane protein assembly factor BamE n=1 Tax=Aestuariibius sp. HNIBRBA575 TaxID=3233343 RepID=UPI0034A1944E
MRKAPKSAAKTLRAAICIAGLGAMVACSPIYRNHGFIPPEQDLSELLVGIDTRDSVEDVVGPPTAGGVTDSSGYYYVQSRFRKFGPFEPQEVEREVLAITFDADGVVQNIERFGLEDGQVVTLSRRVTDDNIQDTTFIRQLMGSFGRVDAEGLLGAPG